jgi:hypothetical protein
MPSRSPPRRDEQGACLIGLVVWLALGVGAAFKVSRFQAWGWLPSIYLALGVLAIAGVRLIARHVTDIQERDHEARLQPHARAVRRAARPRG